MLRQRRNGALSVGGGNAGAGQHPGQGIAAADAERHLEIGQRRHRAWDAVAWRFPASRCQRRRGRRIAERNRCQGQRYALGVPVGQRIRVDQGDSGGCGDAGNQRRRGQQSPQEHAEFSRVGFLS